jgi:hypothetical protein
MQNVNNIQTYQEQAYSQLLEKCKELFPSVNKILWSSLYLQVLLRMNLKRVLDLQKSACLADDGYVPNLWYCDLLSFNAI